MKLLGISCIFPSKDIRKTAEYYKTKLEFDIVEYLQSEQPHICMYKDNIEIILTQAKSKEIKPNRVLYGYGYDAYFYTNNQLELQEKLKQLGVKIAIPLNKTDYNNREFVIEDIDGRYIAFGLKEK